MIPASALSMPSSEKAANSAAEQNMREAGNDDRTERKVHCFQHHPSFTSETEYVHKGSTNLQPIVQCCSQPSPLLQ